MLTVILVDSLVLFWFVVKICHVTPDDKAWTNLYGDKEHHQVCYYVFVFIYYFLKCKFDAKG